MTNGILNLATKNNKVAALIINAILITGIATTATAQTATVVLTKSEAVLKMATSQYWGVKNENKQAKKHAAANSATINSPSNYNITGEDKYLKTTEAGKRYSEFQVFDINKMDGHQVAMGLMTNTLDRGTRYDEKGSVAVKVNITTNSTTGISNSTGLATTTEKVQGVSISSSMDKNFVILAGNDYRYMDGKKLTGDKKIVDGLAQGKPISESTFFYGLQKAGIADKNMTVTQFSKLSASAKQAMLNTGAIATL